MDVALVLMFAEKIGSGISYRTETVAVFTFATFDCLFFGCHVYAPFQSGKIKDMLPVVE